MKKILITACVIIMAFTFTACGEKSNSNQDSSIGYGSNNQSGSGMGSDIKSDISSGMSEVESFTESTADKLTGDNNGNGSMNNSANNNTNNGSMNANSSVNSSSKARLSENHIKEKVLKHAGINEKDLKYFDVDVDYENGRTVYDVDFVSGNTEYSYEIDANTGDIIEHEKEIND